MSQDSRVYGVGSSMITFLVLIFAFFSDGFLYGLVIPLSAHSPTSLETWMLGFLFAVYALTNVFVTLFLGTFAHRLGRGKSLLIAGTFFQFLSVLSFGMASTFPGLVFARVAQGISSATIWTLGLAFIADLYRENRAQKMGCAMLFYSVGLVLGPSLGAS